MSDWPTVIVGVAGLGTTLGAVYLGSLLERAHRNEDLRRQELAERNRKLRSDASDLMSLTNRLVYHIPHKVPFGGLARLLTECNGPAGAYAKHRPDPTR